MLFLLVVSFPVTMVWSACLPTTGPAGAYDCYSGKFYNYQPQWATCVTNAYLSQKSKGTSPIAFVKSVLQTRLFPSEH